MNLFHKLPLFTEQLLCAEYCIGHITWTLSFNLKQLSEVFIIHIFKLRNLPQDHTEIVTNGIKNRTTDCQTPRSVLFSRKHVVKGKGYSIGPSGKGLEYGNVSSDLK